LISYIRFLGQAGGSIALLVILSTTAACAIKAVLPDPLEAGWRGAPVCELLHEDSDQRILRCEFKPGVGHERHFHDPHFGYAILGGRMQITDGNGIREIDVLTGSSFTSAGVVWHEVMNVGSTTTAFLIVEPK